MVIDGVSNVLRGPGAHFVIVVFDDKFHL
jgi:hypothetical protein